MPHHTISVRSPASPSRNTVISDPRWAYALLNVVADASLLKPGVVVTLVNEKGEVVRQILNTEGLF